MFGFEEIVLRKEGGRASQKAEPVLTKLVTNRSGHSHVQATILGPSITVPVGDGEPILGTWQQIFHLECDGTDP